MAQDLAVKLQPKSILPFLVMKLLAHNQIRNVYNVTPDLQYTTITIFILSTNFALRRTLPEEASEKGLRKSPKPNSHIKVSSRQAQGQV